MEVRFTGEQQVRIVIIKFCVLSGQRQSMEKQVHFKKKIPLSVYPVDLICFLFVCLFLPRTSLWSIYSERCLHLLQSTFCCLFDTSLHHWCTFCSLTWHFIADKGNNSLFSGRRPWVPWVMTHHWHACPTSTPWCSPTSSNCSLRSPTRRLTPSERRSSCHWSVPAVIPLNKTFSSIPGLFSWYMPGAKWNCCRLSACSVYTM